MDENIRLQGRDLSPSDIDFIRWLIDQNPDWSRRRISIELCEIWNWRNAKGVLKDMASRAMLVKLNERGLIRLPERRQVPTNRMNQRQLQYVLHDTTPIEQSLKSWGPRTQLSQSCVGADCSANRPRLAGTLRPPNLFT